MNARILPVLMLLVLALAFSGCLGAAYKAGDQAYVRGDVNGALAEYQAGAADGDAGSLFALGAMNASGQGMPQNDALALDYYQQAADLGSPEAMTVLGLRYLGDEGVPKDQARGVDLLLRAAEAGCPLAAAELAYLYQQGIYLPQDEKMAEIMAWTAEANGMAPPEVGP